MTADTITAADIRINARWLIPIEPAGTVLEHQAVIIQGDRLAAIIPQEQADPDVPNPGNRRSSAAMLSCPA